MFIGLLLLSWLLVWTVYFWLLDLCLFFDHTSVSVCRFGFNKLLHMDPPASVISLHFPLEHVQMKLQWSACQLEKGDIPNTNSEIQVNIYMKIHL